MAITKDGLFRYNTLTERERKNLIILDSIRRKGPISKASLSKELGYNIVTLSNYIEEYRKKNLTYEKGLDVSSGGRRPVLLELNKEAGFIIGIDFARETLRGALTDVMLNVISEVKLPRPQIEQEEVKRSLVQLIGELIKKSGVDAKKIMVAGIGVYGSIGEKNGTIKGLDEDKGKSRATIYFIELNQAIEKEFNIKTFFGQDASLAAFGEKARNPSADVDSMLYIFQDIGRGVVVKGEIFCSTDIGGVDLEGLTGDLKDEDKASLREESLYLRPWNSKMSLKSEAMRVIESGVGTKIVELLKGDMQNITDDIIMKAASQADDIAVELIEGVGINLGVRVAYLINLFLPQVVIIGGGIEKARELLFGRIEKTIEKLSLEKSRRAVRIVPGILGDMAVSFGAAAVGLREQFLEA